MAMQGDCAVDPAFDLLLAASTCTRVFRWRGAQLAPWPAPSALTEAIGLLDNFGQPVGSAGS
jgi:hypothetical protein